MLNHPLGLTGEVVIYISTCPVPGAARVGQQIIRSPIPHTHTHPAAKCRFNGGRVLGGGGGRLPAAAVLSRRRGRGGRRMRRRRQVAASIQARARGGGGSATALGGEWLSSRSESEVSAAAAAGAVPMLPLPLEWWWKAWRRQGARRRSAGPVTGWLDVTAPPPFPPIRPMFRRALKGTKMGG